MSLFIILEECIVLSGVSGVGIERITRIKTGCNHPMLFQYRASVEDYGFKSNEISVLKRSIKLGIIFDCSTIILEYKN